MKLRVRRRPRPLAPRARLRRMARDGARAAVAVAADSVAAVVHLAAAEASAEVAVHPVAVVDSAEAVAAKADRRA